MRRQASGRGAALAALLLLALLAGPAGAASRPALTAAEKEWATRRLLQQLSDLGE